MTIHVIVVLAFEVLQLNSMNHRQLYVFLGMEFKSQAVLFELQ